MTPESFRERIEQSEKAVRRRQRTIKRSAITMCIVGVAVWTSLATLTAWGIYKALEHFGMLPS